MYNKYGNIKKTVFNITFDSTAEANRYLELRSDFTQGKIQNLILQPSFILQDGYIRNGKKIREIKYIADFGYIKDSQMHIEDVKGKKTKEYSIKKKMLLFRYPALVFIETIKGKKILS